MSLFQDHPDKNFWEYGSGDDWGALEHLVGRAGDEAETHVLQHRWAGVSYGRNDEDPWAVRGFAFLQRSGIAFAGVEEEAETERLTDKHREGLHVGMEEFFGMFTLSDCDWALEFICWVSKELPKVEMVPEMRKRPMASSLTFLEYIKSAESNFINRYVYKNLSTLLEWQFYCEQFYWAFDLRITFCFIR